MVSFQQHLPEQAQKQRRSTGHPKVGHHVVLVVHGRPLAVLLLHRLLQLLLVLLGHGVLREKLGQRLGEAVQGVRRPGVRCALSYGGEKLEAPGAVRAGHVGGPGEGEDQRPVQLFGFLGDEGFLFAEKAGQLGLNLSTTQPWRKRKIQSLNLLKIAQNYL